MKRGKDIFAVVAMVMMLCVACGGTKAKSTAQEKENSAAQSVAVEYDYRIIAHYPHASTSYTQGLQYVDGVMWEGTGREGHSKLQRIDLTSGKVEVVASLPKEEFGEGITHHQGEIYQLTWLSNIAHVYSTEGKHLRTIPYQGEGWGITSSGEELYLSDGTATIRQIDPATFATERSIVVTYEGYPLNYINELEWIEGKIWANVYVSSVIVEIEPSTGVVVGYIDLEELHSMLEDNPEAEVLNGIAYNNKNGHLYVTGKDWNKIFEIEIIK